MSRSIRISHEHWRRLKLAAAAGGERLQTVAERWLTMACEPWPVASVGDWRPREGWPSTDLVVAGPPAGPRDVVRKELPGSNPGRVAGARAAAGGGAGSHVPQPALIADAEGCPKCGCRPLQHHGGAGKNRCERHPTCVWNGDSR